MAQQNDFDSLESQDYSAELSRRELIAPIVSRHRNLDRFGAAYQPRKFFVLSLSLVALLFLSYGSWALVSELKNNPDKAAGSSDSSGQKSIVVLPGADQILTVNPKLQVQNDTSIKGDLIVDGSTTLHKLKVDGDVGVTGSGAFGGDVTATNIVAQNFSGSFNGTYSGSGNGLTNLNASTLTSGTLSDVRLSSNVTVQGNTFNGVNELVKLDANGALPVASGNYLTDVNAATLNGQAIGYFTNASNFSSGTLSDVRLSTNVALLNANNAFTNTNTFVGGVTVQGTVSGQSAVFANDVAALTFTQNGNVVCDTSGNCGSGGGSGGVAGSGTTNSLALFTSAGAIGNSIISQSGTTIIVAGTLVATDFQGNGNALTNLNATNLTGGTLPDARLSSNVTLMGNTFNGPSQLVQLTAGGLLPSLNGSNVSSVNASALQGFVASYFTNATNQATGTLPDARLSNNVALLNAANTFTGVTNTFSGLAATTIKQNGNTVCDTSGNCSGVGGGVTTAGGVAGTIALFSAGQQIANSILTQAGSTITVAGTLVATALQGNGSALTNLNASNVSSGTLAVSFGGTGASTFTSNGIIYGNGTGALQATTAGTTGQCLVGNTAAAPSWASCSSAGSGGTPGGAAGGDLSGTYPNPTVAKLQGTALSVASLASGDFLLYNGTNWANHSLTGDITVTGGGVATIGAGTVTNAKLVNSSLTVTPGPGLSGGGSVSLGGSTSISVAYGSVANTAVQGNTTITCSSGAGNLAGGGGTVTLGSGGSCGSLNTVASPSFTSLTLASPLLIASGGTGASTFTSNGIIYGNTTGPLQVTAAGTSGQCLVGNTAAAPAWASCTAAAGGATPGGPAGGDLTGSYPNPTIAKLQGSTLTIAALGVGQVLQYNGSAFVNSLVTNSNLAAGTFANITGTGSLTAGSIAAGFGAISTNNSISTSSSLQGAAVTATGLLTANGGITDTGNFAQTGVGTFSTGTGTVSLNGTTSVSGIATFVSSAVIQGSAGLTLGSTTNTGVVKFLDGTSDGFTANLQVATITGSSKTYTIPNSSAATDSFCLVTLANCSGAGVSTIGALDGGTANANGATISGSTIYLQSASASFAGLINTGAQSFAGAKTFGNDVKIQASLSDTLTSLRVLQNGGSSVFVVNANDNFVGIGSSASAPNSTLQVAGTFTTAGGLVKINNSSNFGTNINGGTSTGAVTIGNALSGSITLQTSNSTTAFSVQNAGGTALLTVDSSANRIIVTTLNATASLLTPLLDTATAIALNIGTTNATAINLNKNVVVAAGMTLTVNGHIITGGTAPTIAAGAAACTTPTVSVAGTDTAGTVTVTTGTGCAATGVLATVTFNTAYGSAPRLSLTARNANAANLKLYNGAVSATTFTIDTNSVPTDATAYLINYWTAQ